MSYSLKMSHLASLTKEGLSYAAVTAGQVSQEELIGMDLHPILSGKSQNQDQDCNLGETPLTKIGTPTNLAKSTNKSLKGHMSTLGPRIWIESTYKVIPKEQKRNNSLESKFS